MVAKTGPKRITWEEVAGFNDGLYPKIKHAIFPGPDGAQVHSVCVDPTDARHLYIGISIGGIFESMDGGQSWRPLNRGVAADFLPDPNLEYGHDPLRMVVPQFSARATAALPGNASTSVFSSTAKWPSDSTVPWAPEMK